MRKIKFLLPLLATCTLFGCAKKQDETVATDLKFYQRECYTENYAFYMREGAWLYNVSDDKKTIYCFDTSCDHKIDLETGKTDCLALLMQCPYLSNNDLYFVKEVTWKEKEFISADKTGGNQKVLTTFENAQNIVGFSVSDKYAYHAFMNAYDGDTAQEMVSRDKEEVLVYRTDLKTGESTLVYENEAYGLDLFDMYVDDGDLYMITRSTDVKYDEMNLPEDGFAAAEELAKHNIVQINRLKQDENKASCILERVGDLYYGLCGEYYLYCNSDEGLKLGDEYLHVYNLNSGEEKVVDAIKYATTIYSCGDDAVISTYTQGTGTTYYDLALDTLEIKKKADYKDSNVYPSVFFDNGVYYSTGSDGCWMKAEDFWR